MTGSPLDVFFGWSAFLSAAATLGTLVTGILFFSVNEKFGRTNDIASVLQVLLMIPVAASMYRLTRVAGSGLALALLAVGVIGMAVAAVLQFLLVLKAVRFEQTIGAVLAAGAAIGVWLISVNAYAFRAGVLPWGLLTSGMVAGAGYLLAAGGFYLGSQRHPLFYAGSGLLVVGYGVWAAWFGWLLLSYALAPAGL